MALHMLLESVQEIQSPRGFVFVQGTKKALYATPSEAVPV